MLQHGILAGVAVAADQVTIAVTEKYTREDLDRYLELVAEWPEERLFFPMTQADLDEYNKEIETMTEEAHGKCAGCSCENA